MLIEAPVAELRRIAATYPPEAAHTTAADRERYFTDGQRAAWDMHFAQGTGVRTRQG